MEMTLAQKVLSEISPATVASTTAVHRVLMYTDYYRKKMKRVQQACRNLKGTDRSKCLLTYKIRATEELVANMKKAQYKCEDDKCKAKIDKRIQNQLAKIENLKQTLDNVIKKSYRNR